MSLVQIWTICSIWNIVNVTYNSYKLKKWNDITILAYIFAIGAAPLVTIIGLALTISDLF